MSEGVFNSENAVTVRQLANVVDTIWNEKIKGVFAPLNSPTFTGTPIAPTPSAGDDSSQVATTEFVHDAVEQGLSVADALTYKGTIAGGSTGDYGSLTPDANKGDVYKVTTAGKVDGIKVEVGDMIICNTDETAAATSSDYSIIVGNWDFVQTNLDGVVVGPESSVDSHVALFNGPNGKLIKDSGVSIETTLTVSDSKVPTSKAVNNAIDNAIGTLDITSISNTAGKTVATITEQDGKVGATFQDIAITSSQISDLTNTYTGTGTTAITDKAVKAAIDALDVSEIGGAGKVITTISETDGKISATAVDYTDIVPAPEADDTLFTGSSDGTTDWQPLVKSTWGTELTDTDDNPITDGENPIMDENATDLWTTFKGVGFGAERAAADVEGNSIVDTYVKKSEMTTALNGKVDKVDGKGLSTEDYTSSDKSKLAGIAEGSQANVIESVSLNGTAITPVNKNVNIVITEMDATDIAAIVDICN